MATAPIFTGTPKCSFAQVSTANTARDGTGTLATIYTAGSSGSRIEHIDISAAGTVTAGAVRLFISDGTNNRLWKEVMVIATTPSTSVQAWNATVITSNLYQVLILPNGYSLKASTHNAETFNVFAFGGDF